MKSRSHRLPISEPRHDDWVDGSWTVDCICGVNFDDGEEMVDCDECGVWVHTRCSRYVKSEKSFACDKCKSKNVGGGIRNDSEETEVAEFLVELPTKTLRMDNPKPASVSSRGPFRLWTEIPMEERVHVQGVPGGDPGLFSGSKMSSVFGPGLWKSSGYVPKKFNFHYTEFPFMNDDNDVEEKGEELEKKNDEKNVNQADNGAGALFSLSKETVNTLSPPVLDSAGAKSYTEDGGSREVVSPRHRKKLDGPEDTVKKSCSAQPIVLYTAKRKKEGLEKDQSVKKKVRTTEQEGDAERRAPTSSKAALSCDTKQTEFSQDRGSKVVSDGTQSGKDNLSDQLSDGLGECATNLASNECALEATLRIKVSSDEISREKNRGDRIPARFENFSKAYNNVASVPELNGCRGTPANEEVPGDDHRNCGDIGRGSEGVGTESQDNEPVAADVAVAGPYPKVSETGQTTNIDKASTHPDMKLKGEGDAVDQGSPFQSLPLDDVKLDTMNDVTQHPESSASLLLENGKAIETSVVKLKASEHKAHDGLKNLTVGSTTVKSDELPGNTSRSKQEPTCSEGSIGARKNSSGHRHGAEVAEKSLKYNGAVRSHSTTPYQHKVVVYVGKSASTSASNIPKASDDYVASTAQDPSVCSRPKEFSESSARTLKDPSADIVAADEKIIRRKKLLKESSRLSSVSRVSQSTKSSSTSDSKIMSSEAKDSTLHSSSKVSSMTNVIAAAGSGESVYPPETEGAPNMQNKVTGSALPGKGEKFYHSGSQPSSRGNGASMNAPASSNVPAILSDEELALLLHQELNSSPRVPRVPRMRHAGSLPQLTCPTATSTLMKRTSSGGKDHSVASRRKTKDLSGEGSHGSPQVDNEVKKMDKRSSSTDRSRRDSDIDSVSRREAGGSSVKGVYSTKPANVGSSLSSSNDANVNYLSSSRPSLRNASDDDPRTASHLANRTLPGLIAEIMSEGKRMTYEELCNAVLPHWPHLRKHNGERYAYSSHSQAVLDCLRNRSEWARLVDRGPKTNASRKRHKTDPDPFSIESEDDSEDKKGRQSKDAGRKSLDSQQEDFPKGKRKARKRRRLALQGRGIVRRRRRADVVSDDESEESFSNSSEDTSSEEDIQGDGTSATGNEASASSDEVH